MKRWIVLTLLGINLLVVITASKEHFREDEGTYVGYATNLTHGFYTSRDPRIMDLRAGPGYALLLFPFAKLGTPWLAAKVLNAFLLLGAVLLLHQTLRLYVPDTTARWGATLMAAYPPFYRDIHLLMSETFAVFLVCAFMYLFCRASRDDPPSLGVVLGAAAALAWLALTKAIFGYVILTILIVCLLALTVRRSVFKRSAVIFALALGLCMPYLALTWSLTGRAFYWTNSGASALYWMSTPYEGELGDWQNDWKPLPVGSRIRHNHQAFLNSVSGLGTIDRSDALQHQAVLNIKSYPTKYLCNWTANVGRLFFSFPFTDTSQKLTALFYALPNTILLALVGLSAFALVVGRRPIPVEVHVLLLVAVVALAGTSLLSATARYLIPLVPLFTLWSVTVLARVMDIRIRGRTRRGSGELV